MITIFSIDWHRILVSLQMFLPMAIWICTTLTAFIHPIFRLIAPGLYAVVVEISRKQKEEYLRKEEEARKKRLQGDAERGISTPSEPREPPRFEVEVDEDTPLTGEGLRG